MEKKESLIVQLVYLRPNGRLPDFRFRPLDSIRLSAGVPSLHKLIMKSDFEKEFDVSNKQVESPWKTKPEQEEPLRSTQITLAQAIVWITKSTFGFSVNVDASYAMAEPADCVFQPKNCFWVVDLKTNFVLAEEPDLAGGIAAYDTFC